MEPFIGQLMLVPYTFAPVGWALCNGQSMSIAQNDALYALIGTTYGGDGTQTFNLPDLRGRCPIHQGQGPGRSSYPIGTVLGTESVTVTSLQLPVHTHTVMAASAATNSSLPNGSVFAATTGGVAYASGGSGSSLLSPQSNQLVGGSQPHSNLQPYLVLNWIIALEGVFPSRG